MTRYFSQTFGVVAALMEQDGKFLLVQESQVKKFDHGKWNHPAGWLEVGEDPLAGVSRESLEETGYDFKPTHLLGVYSLVRNDLKAKTGQARHPIKLVFIGEFKKAKGAKLADDVSQVKWFRPEEIYAMDTKTLRDLDIKQMVKDYLAGQKFPLAVLKHTVVE